MGPGDLSDNDGRGAVCAAEMFNPNLGRVAARAAYMVAEKILEVENM
jgi:hypothetical protein